MTISVRASTPRDGYYARAEAAANCHGNLDTHCCWHNGVVCMYLEEDTVPGRRWACALYRELGSWDAVHADQRYIDDIQPHWDAYPYEKRSEVGVRLNCGDWPQRCGPADTGDRCCLSFPE